jgi:predicted HTH transcriptional regulator
MNENEILIKHLQTCTEFQMFDRKSVRIEPKALATTMIAFANADGGQFAIGIEDDGRITGIDGHEAHVNELLRANLDFCVPSVSIDTKYIECEDVNHMFIDMEKAKQPIPEYRQVEFMLKVRAKSAFEGEGVSQEEEMHQEKEEMHQEMHQEKEELHQESSYANLDEKQKAILDFCVEPRSTQEILENFGLYNQSRTRKRYIADLVEKGLLVMTIPNNPTDRNQKYQRKQLAENQDPQT